MRNTNVHELVDNAKRSREPIPLICDFCGKGFYQTKNIVKRSLKRNQNNFYCDRYCKGKASRVDKSRVCEFCGKVFEYTDKNSKYCSSSCAASVNNTLSPKRKRLNKKTCERCGERRTGKSPYCKSCLKEITYEASRSKTLGELKASHRYGNHKYTEVRTQAREFIKRLGVSRECEVNGCGFDVYLEVCHIIPITSFPEDTPITKINSRENLLLLCPNHHKLLDKGLLDMQ